MPDPIKLSNQPVLSTVPDRTRFPLLLHPADEPDEDKRNPTAGLRAVAAALGAVGPGPNKRPDLLKAVRFYLKADRDADLAAGGIGGGCFEELNDAGMCLATRVYVEKYRTATSQETRNNVTLVAKYDQNGRLYPFADGEFAAGTRLPAVFVPVDEAPYGYVRRDTIPASINNWRVGELEVTSINGQDQFCTHYTAGGPFSPYTGVDDGIHRPAARPTPPVPTPPPNKRPDLLKAVRFYLKADRDADLAAGGVGGGYFAALNDADMCLATRVYVEKYRTSTSEEMHSHVTLVASYDSAGHLYPFVDGEFMTGTRLPATFVPMEDAPYGYVRRDTIPASISDWRVGELEVTSIDGQDQFCTHYTAGGPFSAYTGVDDGIHRPAAKPPTQYGYTDQQINALLAEKGDAEIQAEHTQQLATLAVQASQVYGYLQDGGAPVGFGSLNASLADTRQKVFQTFNVATLSMTASNPANGSGWAYATNAQGTTLDMAANVVLSLPGSDVGSLTFTEFYIQGGRGSKVRLLTTAPATNPPARLPRLAGYCGVPLELASGGAVLLSGYYVSLLGTGTVYAVPPFSADSVAAGVNVVLLGGGGDGYTDAQAKAAALASLIAGNSQHQGVQVADVGGVPKLSVSSTEVLNTVHFQAANVSGNAYSDLELFALYRLDVFDGAYNLASWEAQILGPDGLALSAVVNTPANLNSALVQAFAGSPAFVLVRHRLLRAATTDAALGRFNYVLA